MQLASINTNNLSFKGYIIQHRDGKEYGVEDTNDDFDLKVLEDLNFRLGKRDLVDIDTVRHLDISPQMGIKVNGQDIIYKFKEIKMTLPGENDTFELTIPRPHYSGKTAIEQKIDHLFDSIRSNLGRLLVISDDRLVERDELDINKDPGQVVDVFSKSMEIAEDELYAD